MAVVTELKNKKEVRKIDKGSLSDKSYNSVFCGINGCGFVKATSEGKCPVCGARIIRPSTYESAVKLFLEVLKVNTNVFNSHIFTEPETKSLSFLVNIGRTHYWVPFRYFIELENLERTKGLDREQMENFFEYIKEHCKQYNP